MGGGGDKRASVSLSSPVGLKEQVQGSERSPGNLIALYPLDWPQRGHLSPGEGTSPPLTRAQDAE